MARQGTLPTVRPPGETHRLWAGESGRHLPRCPCNADETCEPSLCQLKEFHCVRCKRWWPFCFGHSESDECLACAEAIEQKILQYVQESKRGYRRESRIRYFLVGTNDVVGGHDVEPTLDYARIDDILYEMVLDKKLEWIDNATVDDVSRGEEDLKYRIPKEPNAQ
jgi:hypothetical protein